MRHPTVVRTFIATIATTLTAVHGSTVNNGSEVSAWLRGIGLERYGAALLAEEYDELAILQSLDARGIATLVAAVRMKPGAAEKLKRAISGEPRQFGFDPQGNPHASYYSQNVRMLSPPPPVSADEAGWSDGRRSLFARCSHKIQRNLFVNSSVTPGTLVLAGVEDWEMAGVR